MEPTSLPSADAEERTPDGRAGTLVARYLTADGVSPYDQVEWERRDAVPGGDESRRVRDVETPATWSQQALDIAAKLYLAKGDDYVETSIRQLISRVCRKIAYEGFKAGYFDTWDIEGGDSTIFYEELSAICLQQLATFNSPVWFNIGRDDRPQCPSACFILDVEDTTESIYDWYRDESKIFKAGSGSGVNVSRLRGSMEPLSTGGIASGPVSFIRPSNAGAETIKSGGMTRRAAKIIQLDDDHPDIVDFIESKVREEDRLRVLAEAGINVGFDIEGERNVAEVTSFQSANNSVRVTDEFMRAVENDEDWKLIARTTGEPVGEPIPARELMHEMADAAYRCADPGVMFHDTINSWHTTPEDAPVTCTNPCGELHTPNNSSCNLASLNAIKFLTDSGQVDVLKMRHVVDVMTLAMDILVDFCELPTETLTRRTKQFRWLGLGFTNMGATIMSKGLPYDSGDARDFAASFMALECGRSYRMSARIAERMGAFDGFDVSRQSMLDVMNRHHSFIPEESVDGSQAWEAALEDWQDVLVFGRKHGYRNAQATVIAPAGTTSFFMDCDTTGPEPAFSLVTLKQMAGGGSMTLVSGSVERSLKSLEYDDEVIHKFKLELPVDREGAMLLLAPEHRDVFHGANEISAEGHIRMIAALQPFISGAASKTINLPETATVEDVRECFELSWRLGVKCISVYRDGSKARQVLSSKPKEKELVENNVVDVAFSDKQLPPSPTRRRLPRTRRSITHKIHVRSQMGEHEGYVTVGMHPDGVLGEMFLEGFGRLGGFTQNALSAWATSVSVGLQYGVPMDVLMTKFVRHSDETGGIVVPSPGEPLVIRSCNSIIDYIARWVIAEFGDVDLQEELGVMTDAVKARKISDGSALTRSGSPTDFAISTNGNGHVRSVEISAHTCPDCHKPLKPAGSCWSCSCGFSTGCG